MRTIKKRKQFIKKEKIIFKSSYVAFQHHSQNIMPSGSLKRRLPSNLASSIINVFNMKREFCLYTYRMFMTLLVASIGKESL